MKAKLDKETVARRLFSFSVILSHRRRDSGGLETLVKKCARKRLPVHFSALNRDGRTNVKVQGAATPLPFNSRV